MVAPITGPFTTGLIVKGPKNRYGVVKTHWQWSRTSYRQTKPYNKPLSFTYWSRRMLSGEQTGYGAAWDYFANRSLSDVPSTVANDANVYNKAYDRFRSGDQGMGTSASLSVTWAERKQAVEMIGNRSLQIAAAAVAIRKLNFRKAASILKCEVPKPRVVYQNGRRVVKKLVRKRTAKAFANNYLEFHFGWSPLVADIGNAVDVLQGGVPPGVCRGSAKKKTVVTQVVKPNSYTTQVIKTTLYQKQKLQSMVVVTNPNLWLANQLGFVNPMLVAWELVPYSFVVDWFVNVGDFLRGFSDNWGVDFIDPQRTIFSKVDREYVETAYYSGKVRLSQHKGQFVQVQRVLGSFPGPKLRVRDPWVLSPRRGLAAISLLLQKL